MKLNINEIKINEGRRALLPEGIEKLAESIASVGLLNPITVNEDNTLIAGYHRLEAAKKLGWTEIECSVHKLEHLEAELAEIDENIVRTQLTTTEEGELLLRRKEIYEALHPETKAGISQAAGMNRAQGNNVDCTMQSTSTPFVQDAAEKLGVNPSTVSRKIQAAKNTTPEAKEIIMENGIDLSQKDALALSRMEPEQQKEAAEKLAAQEIKSVSEYTDTSSDTIQKSSEMVQDDEGAARMFSEYGDFIQTVMDGIDLYAAAPERFSGLSPEQIKDLSDRTEAACTAMKEFSAQLQAIIQS